MDTTVDAEFDSMSLHYSHFVFGISLHGYCYGPLLLVFLKGDSVSLCSSPPDGLG